MPIVDRRTCTAKIPVCRKIAVSALCLELNSGAAPHLDSKSVRMAVNYVAQ